jgi:flagellar protein FliO/FliZ
MLSTLLRLVFSLGVVLALMALAGRFLASRQSGGRLLAARPRNAAIRVLGRHGVGRTASVTLVQVGGRVLLLGVTESSIQVLRELAEEELAQDTEPPDLASQPAAPKFVSVAALLDLARERTTRRT